MMPPCEKQRKTERPYMLFIMAIPFGEGTERHREHEAED